MQLHRDGCISGPAGGQPMEAFPGPTGNVRCPVPVDGQSKQGDGSGGAGICHLVESRPGDGGRRGWGSPVYLEVEDPALWQSAQGAARQSGFLLSVQPPGIDSGELLGKVLFSLDKARCARRPGAQVTGPRQRATDLGGKHEEVSVKVRGTAHLPRLIVSGRRVARVRETPAAPRTTQRQQPPALGITG